jgi:molecular chaperone DnaJ
MMRLRGKGAPHLRGRGRGDEYVRIVVAVPEKLTREQKKLVEEMKDGGM